jgi:antitoxin (DNA-binding transcriptional repressor) of toxin-antitoxin stability system
MVLSRDFKGLSGGIAMTQVTIAEAQQRLPELLSAAEAGERVTIRGDNGRTFTLAVEHPAPMLNPDWPGYPHAGSAKGLIKIADDFGAPIEELKDYTE